MCQSVAPMAALSLLPTTHPAAMDALTSNPCTRLSALPQPLCFPLLLANSSSPSLPLLLCHFLQEAFPETLPSTPAYCRRGTSSALSDPWALSPVPADWGLPEGRNESKPSFCDFDGRRNVTGQGRWGRPPWWQVNLALRKCTCVKIQICSKTLELSLHSYKER